MDDLRRDHEHQAPREDSPVPAADRPNALPPLDDPLAAETAEQQVEDSPEEEVATEIANDSEPAGTFAATTTPGPAEPERKRRRALGRRGNGDGDEPKQKRVRQKKQKKDKDKREKKLIGLKIGASQIAAARIVNNGSPELVDAFREPLPPGVVVSGEIRDTEALAGALTRFFELHKLPKKGVRVGLSNNRIGVRVFEIEGVADEKQLENAIRFRAEEVLPIPLDEAVLDYVVLDDDTREDGTPVRRILLVVAYREVVDRYLEACRAAGLEVVGVDLEAFALLRSLAAPTDEPGAGGALVAVAVGYDRTTIAVSTGRYCEFTRVLDWGGWSLNVAIARELDVAPSEVESVKRQLSLNEQTTIEGLTPEQSTKVRDAVQRALSAFTRELVSSLHFYQAQPGALGIGEIVITGGTAHMPGLAESVGRLIGAPVRLGDPFQRVRLGRNVVPAEQAGSLAVAIGLGIED
jgi:type IV pilus assembly protein PilM